MCKSITLIYLLVTLSTAICNESSITFHPQTTRWPYYNDSYDFIPKPEWSPVEGHINFHSIEDFEKFRDRLRHIHSSLVNTSYNSVTSLIRLYNDYKVDEDRYKGNFRKFYFDYQPLVSENHQNCVGLTMKLKNNCEQEFRNQIPHIDKCFFFAAGEMLLAPENDILTRPSLRGNEEWKHVALAAKFYIKDRRGYFFMDQSFGTPVVTLMEDRNSPHDNNFKANHRYNLNKYTYDLTANGFIKFTRESQTFMSNDKKTRYGGFYLRYNHASIMNLTEKKAIIKTKRCVVKRTPDMRRLLDSDILLNNGSIFEVYVEGKYFPEMRVARINLEKTNLSCHSLGISERTLKEISQWNEMYGYQKGVLLEIIRNISRIAQDTHFINQLRQLDVEINNVKPKRQDYFLMSSEYEDNASTSSSEDVIYHNFVKMLDNLTSSEVIGMMEHYQEETANKYKVPKLN